MRALKTAALTTGALTTGALTAGALNLRAVLTAVALAALVAGCGSSGPGSTAAAVNATVPAHVTWKSSAKFGRWPDGRYFVLNNEWNTSQAGPQTVWADSYHQWGVVSKQPDSTSVKTYPSVQLNYPNPPLSSISSLRSSFDESMPSPGANYDAEAAYDIWLDNYKTEVMVWVDNHKQTPEGGVVTGTVVDGQPFTIFEGNSHMYSLVLAGTHESKGTMNLLAALHALVQRGFISSSDTLTQVDFGWEVASTDNVPMSFEMHSYSLTSALSPS
jgi:hypothetical protein